MGVIETMSKEESAFVRLYVRTLQRDYDILSSAIGLLSKKGLAVNNFLTAVALACRLSGLHSVFDAQLRRLQTTQNENIAAADLVAVEEPTLEKLAEIFTLSFFQLLPAPEKYGAPLNHRDLTGWFSGQPIEWAAVINTAVVSQKKKKTKKDNNALKDMTPLSKLISDLFLGGGLFGLSKSPAKQIWPPPAENWWVDDMEIDDQDLDIGSFEDWFDSEE